MTDTPRAGGALRSPGPSPVAFPYRLLWQERIVRSVANLTREDAHAFMAIASAGFIRTHPVRYRLQDRRCRAGPAMMPSEAAPLAHRVTA
jgi:D-arabinose 1-dehydrogenase-like Zn-dependent alcohol dehydrogenase